MESKENELSAELSRLNMKVRKAEAKEKVYSSHVADHDFAEKDVDTKIPKHEHNHKGETPTVPSQFNPGDFVTTSQIQIAMMDMIELQSAPQPDLDEFDGNPLEYLYFKANFEDVVASKVRDQRGKLTRLITYTKGNPKELIKPFVHDDSGSCYDNAIALLDKEYGNHHLITCSCLEELRQWERVKDNEAEGFKKLYRFLLKCQAYKSPDRLTELDSTEMIKRVLSEVHSSIQNRWVRKTLDIGHHQSKEADFNDLVRFFPKEAEVLSDPAYLRDALMELVR